MTHITKYIIKTYICFVAIVKHHIQCAEGTKATKLQGAVEYTCNYKIK